MSRKILIPLVGISLLACNFLFPPDLPPTPAITPLPSEAPTEEATSEPVTTSETHTEFEDITFIRLHPADGDLQTLLAAEAQKAVALGQTPIAYFDATWCPPCLAIADALEEQNPLMLEAYKGTYILKIDVDEWGWNNGAIGDFQFDAIPIYFKLDANGNQTGEVIDGGAWNEDIPENIAPVMDKFFHGDS